MSPVWHSLPASNKGIVDLGKPGRRRDNPEWDGLQAGQNMAGKGLGIHRHAVIVSPISRHRRRDVRRVALPASPPSVATVGRIGCRFPVFSECRQSRTGERPGDLFRVGIRAAGIAVDVRRPPQRSAAAGTGWGTVASGVVAGDLFFRIPSRPALRCAGVSGVVSGGVDRRGFAAPEVADRIAGPLASMGAPASTTGAMDAAPCRGLCCQPGKHGQSRPHRPTQSFSSSSRIVPS